MATKKKAAGKKPAAKKGKKGGKKNGLIIVIGLVVLVLLMVEGFYLAKSQASQVIELVHMGPILEKTIPNTRYFTGDKQGNFYRLNGMNETWKLQKYSPEFRFVAEYKPVPGKVDQILQDAKSIAIDPEENVYVAQANGVVKVLDKDMKYVRQFATKVPDVLGIDLDSQGRIYLSSRGANKIAIFDNAGAYVSELGAPESSTGAIAQPSDIVIQPDDTVIFRESLSEGVRIRVLAPDLKPRKTFIIKNDKLKPWEFMEMGVDPAGLLYFNDASDHGIMIYDSKKGKLHGFSKATQDNQAIIAPGGMGVNKWTGDVYIDYIPGVMKCKLPAQP